jgi:hypothetical protein
MVDSKFVLRLRALRSHVAEEMSPIAHQLLRRDDIEGAEMFLRGSRLFLSDLDDLIAAQSDCCEADVPTSD